MAWVRFPKRFIILLFSCFISSFLVIKYLNWMISGKVSSRPEYIMHFDGKDASYESHRFPSERIPSFPKSDSYKKKHSHENHPWMFPRPLSELENNVVPNQVFFVWCQNRTFTFNDYLSVLSVWKMLEPDKLEIHQGTDIQTDKYNQWFQELNSTIPVLTVKVIKTRSICGNPLQYALELLSDRGGIFVNFSTVFLQSVHFLRKENFSISFNSVGDVAFVVSRIHSVNMQQVLSRENLSMKKTIFLLELPSRQYTMLCPSVSLSLPFVIQENQEHKIICVTLSSKRILTPLHLRSIQDKDLMILNDLYYFDLTNGKRRHGDEPAKDKAIPFIVHYVWFGASEFSFRMYLSFLSAIFVAKAERVFIHCDLYLSGHYWKTVSSHPKVTIVYREPPHHIFGHQVLYTQHRSDVVRADLLDKYGGIYVDWDVLWLQSPAPLLSLGHEVVVNLDHMPREHFPEILNLGVLLSQPRSRFVRLWRWELRNYRSKDFFYNALELPYKVYERYPDTAFIEKRLQVMCFWLKCHPIFHPDHKDWMMPQPFDWKKDVYSIHFTHPDPEEYESIVSLYNATGTFAEIGMFILDVSGDIAFH